MVRIATRVLPLLAVLLLLVLPLPLLAQEPQPIVVTATSVRYSFGQQATFEIQVAAGTAIDELFLYLEEEGAAGTEVVPVPLEDAASTQAAYQRDLRLHPFPPFGQVTWWWEVRGEAGQRVTTEPSTLEYVDDRFEWQATSDGAVHIHADVDDPAYAQTALDIARTGLARIVEELESPALAEVHVYLYPSLTDLRAALEMAGREWMGGQARPELGAVLVAVPYDDEFVARMEQDIPHELTHLVVYEVTGPEGYTRVPAWLDEGLAMDNQARPDPNMDALLEQARAEGRLIPLSDLCAPFPSDPQAALLSYAQSASLVRYIRDRYGDTGIRALLAVYADGLDCEGGIVRALNVGPERLDLAWRAHMMGLSGSMTWLADNGPWLLLWGLSVLLALPMRGVIRRRGE